MFDLSQSEIRNIDAALEGKLAWAADRSAAAEQLALDASRLLSCTENRLQDYVGQGFFYRCWFTLSGKTGSLERATQSDLIEMQKYGWRFINLLQERDLMLAHSIIAVKNNLTTLAFDHDDLKSEVNRLANRVYDRFVQLDGRVGDLEVSQRIHGWLLTIETRDYDTIFPQNLRLLRVVSDFYSLKSDSWNINEIRCMHKAMKQVGIDIRKTIGISQFVDGLIDEIDQIGYREFSSLVSHGQGDDCDDDFVIESISAPVFSSLYQIKKNYTSSSRVITSLKKRVRLNHAEAIKLVLSDFIDEQGIDTNSEVSLKDLATEILACFGLVGRLAAEQRDSLGEMTSSFHSNKSMPEDDDAEALAAADGDAMSQYFMGLNCSVGLGLSQDYAKAMEWYRKAADQGNALAQCSVGELYHLGQGVPQDYAKAMEWYRKAADQGHADAQCSVGNLFHLGQGVPQDYVKAIEWYRKAAGRGDANAHRLIGNLYDLGQGVPQDYAKAMEWYRNASEQEDSEAQRLIGILYYLGQGVPQDYAKAMEWYRKAADQGNAGAQYSVGNLFHFGLGAPQDYVKAIEWYRKAADQGNPDAQCSVGSFYVVGQGVPQDYAKGMVFYRDAADQGHADAQRLIGMLYDLGLGVPEDYEQAMEWYLKAANQGNQDAKDAIEKLVLKRQKKSSFFGFFDFSVLRRGR